MVNTIAPATATVAIAMPCTPSVVHSTTMVSATATVRYSTAVKRREERLDAPAVTPRGVARVLASRNIQRMTWQESRLATRAKGIPYSAQRAKESLSPVASSRRPLAIRCDPAPTSVPAVDTKITVGINKANARVVRRSSAARLRLRYIGTITAARPDVEGTTADNGNSTTVTIQNTPPTVRARRVTSPVRRAARPVLCTAPPRMNAPIISQTTSEDSESSSSCCSAPPRAIKTNTDSSAAHAAASSVIDHSTTAKAKANSAAFAALDNEAGSNSTHTATITSNANTRTAVGIQPRSAPRGTGGGGFTIATTWRPPGLAWVLNSRTRGSDIPSPRDTAIWVD